MLIAMRNAFKLLALAAAVAATTVSCNKEIEAPNVEEPLNLIIRAGAPETRTAISNNGDGTYTPSWGAGDAIGVFFTEVTGSPVEFDNSEAGLVATFAPKTEISGITGDQTLYAFYPFGAFNATIQESTSVRMNVKDTQTPTSVSTFDPSADLLVAKPYAGNVTTITSNGGIVDMKFARVLSVVKITPTDGTTGSILSDEFVKSIKMEYNGVSDNNDDPLTGRVALDLNTGDFGNWTVKTYSAAANYNDVVFALNGTNAAYIIVNPATIASGKTLTFTVKTDKHDIVKEITLTKDLSFPAGNIATIALNLNDECSITDNSLDPNIVFKTPFFADISSNTTYVASTHGDLGVVGTSKSTITYTFNGTNQLRNNSNKISADDASFYYCANSTGLVIGGINVGTNRYFTLTYDYKVPTESTTLALSISEDGIHFFPITSSETITVTGTSAQKGVFSFSIPEGEYSNLKLKFENKGSNGVVIDNVTLTKLESAATGSTSVSFEVVAVDPVLVVTPSPVSVAMGNTAQLTVTGTNGALSYTSNDTGVATVSDAGLITPVSVGTTTIDITSEATEDYNAGSTSVTVNVTAELTPQGLPYENTLINSHTDFTINNVSTGSLSTIWSDSQYGVTANANKTTSNVETYLESPLINLSSVSSATLSFNHCIRYFKDVETAKAQTALEVRVKNGDWIPVEIPTYPTTQGNTGVNTEVSLDDYAGSIIQFRFKYLATSTDPGRWQIKNLTVDGVVPPAHEITINNLTSPLTVELNGDATKTTTLSIASNYTWSVKSTTGQPENYSYSIDSGTQITVTPAADNTSGSTNEGIGTMVLTDGTVDFSITFNQANKASVVAVPNQTITFSELYSANTTLDGVTINGTNCSLVFNKRDGGTATQYYTNGNAVRWYGGGSLAITSKNGYKITSIKITYTQTSNEVSANKGSYTFNDENKIGTWIGEISDGDSVTFTQSGTTGHNRISSIEIN